jgi:hypothetical protein
MAAKDGKKPMAFLANLSRTEIYTHVSSLRASFGSAPSPERTPTERLPSARSSTRTWLPSTAYPEKSQLEGTRILVDDTRYPDKSVSVVEKYVRACESGQTWYRGLAISHFSYGTLQATGVLTSDGTADRPAFTMDDAGLSTRWLPGDNSPLMAEGVALAGMPELADPQAGKEGREEKAAKVISDVDEVEEFPVGVVAALPIGIHVPTCFLNGGEQVVRGPITPSSYVVLVRRGRSDFRRVPIRSFRDLPPLAPYRKAYTDPALVVWRRAALAWVARHP